MADRDRSESEGTDAAPQRRPYEPPAIEESSEFETLSLACGKGNPGACYGGPYRNS
jgi:hypothetical protein